MAQAKKKAATKTAAKKGARPAAKKYTKTSKKGGLHYEKYQRGQKSNMFFVVSMTALAATLLFADLLMMTA